MKTSIVNRIKRLETKLIPNKGDMANHFKYTFKNWTMDDIKAALFGNPSLEVIEKWNSTDWEEHPVYLQYLSVPELKSLEQMIIKGELWCGA